MERAGELFDSLSPDASPRLSNDPQILAQELGVPIEGPHVADRYWIDRLAEDGAKYGVLGQSFEPTRWLTNGDQVTVGELTFEVRHCPGHTPGHVVFHHPESKLALVGDEPWLPYQRPPLSKKFLAGALERERLMLRPTQFYTDHTVETHLGRRVEEIRRGDQRVRLDDGSLLAYDALLLATGSRPRKLLAPGADLGGVHFLRTIADVDRIRADLGPGKRLVIIKTPCPGAHHECSRAGGDCGFT